MRIRGVGTAKLVAKWLRTRFGRPGPLILGYHRISKAEWDPQQLCVSPQCFEEQLEIMMRGGQALSLFEFVRRLRGGDDLSRTFVITFDDGYEDTLTAAIPILEQFDVPATVFIPTGMIGKPFWWCEIQEIVNAASQIPGVIVADLGGIEFRWEAVPSASDLRAPLIHALCAHFRSVPYGRTDAALRTLCSVLESPAYTSGTVRAMSAEQVVELSGHPLVEVGSHTVTHKSLKGIGINSQREEVRQSKEALQALCGRQIESFAYPNGSISREAPALLEELEFRCGVTSLVRPVSRRTSPYLLPRPFVGDWNGDEFSRWIERWFA